MNLSAQAATDLYELLRLRGIRCWVMGGWGVDALLGEQTREHHDLDVLVPGEDLPALGQLFGDHGFGIKQVWEAENRWLDMDGSTWPTAFVAGSEEGVELDIHVITFEAGFVVPLCKVAWPLDSGLLTGTRRHRWEAGGLRVSSNPGGDASGLRTTARPPARRGPAMPTLLTVGCPLTGHGPASLFAAEIRLFDVRLSKRTPPPTPRLAGWIHGLRERILSPP